jgi:NodT family efflux transporter outer membrane factor (OMF) lipoprotein
MRLATPILVLLLAGCASIGPNYVRPEATGSSGNWISKVDTGPVDERWWTALGDDQLNALIDKAIAANLDLREALARLREARASRDAALGRTMPELRVTGSATQQQLSENGQLPAGKIPGFDRGFSLFDAGFDAAWELDVWGGNRRAVEAADARARQAEARLADVRLTVIAELVRAYADLRTAQARGSLLQQEADLRASVADLVARRFRAGETSRLDWDNSLIRAAAARAAAPESDVAAKAATYRLAVLTGQAPEATLTLAETAAPLPNAPEVVAAAVRSELLVRRPDIAAAEADLVAANAEIGVQTAQLYPRFTLVGSIGQQSRAIGDLVDGGSTRYSLGPSFAWPVFSFGRIRAQVRAADARTQGALSRYERTVLSALAEAETAANRFAKARVALSERDAAVRAGVEAAELAQLRFSRGEDDRIQMLEARSVKLGVELAQLATKAEVLTAFVALEKSLGGGAGASMTASSH